MTTEVRLSALSLAIQATPGGESAAQLVSNAREFLTFLTADADADESAAETAVRNAGPGRPRKAPAAAAAPESAPAPAKPAKAAKTKAEAPADQGPTKAQVAAALKVLIDKGAREDAVKILANHGAASVSELSEDEYAAVLEEAQDAAVSL